MSATSEPEAAAAVPARGRPTAYTQEIADYICAQIANKRSLNSICQEDGMPHEATVRGWALDNRCGFFTKYSRARMLQQYGQIEEVIDIADAEPRMLEIETTIGGMTKIERRIDPAFEQWRKSRMMGRQWQAARTLPEYREKTDTNHHLSVEVKDLSRVELEAIAAQGRLTIEGTAVSENTPIEPE